MRERNMEKAGQLVDVLRKLPLRVSVSVWQTLTRDVFDATNAPVVDWGDDPELEGPGATIDDELAFLAHERRALEDLTVTAAQVARSAEASIRAFAAHHDRVVTRADVLDADLWTDHPAVFTPGEFAQTTLRCAPASPQAPPPGGPRPGRRCAAVIRASGHSPATGRCA